MCAKIGASGAWGKGKAVILPVEPVKGGEEAVRGGLALRGRVNNYIILMTVLCALTPSYAHFF
jgi:hypothetical protein